ncbi:hypothetical protein ASPZODRAFT_70008 [Penicilliopsis zonata CBS 506.65]|uniref:Copper-fist domain-containing protein n=1 Tax=Penicilliopsis zonata CBS 506.65 TaxID=1073090 RepID=A0A1L9SE79_9EURO|nr:hypothetical protein ASPZODRAFT_70008 [Penicilliopsis zonata CBS 506.65]OJJ45462.1 hypothetical protein ASPZODRAFT_70008 [Penicilliopsis zonata CBS 506.65]
MLIDGEKWACEACVRGHRVSSCHHSDRPLTHINKKGRPVSQCTHCRGLRKSRTTHVKCECGDKKKSHGHKSDPDSDKSEHDEDSRPRCSCSHGQRCSCALKKEHHLDPVPEAGLPQPSALSETKKPLLTSTKSDSTLTVFRDGHHKPAHKHNDMAHKCGMPYTIPRSHTVHSTADIARRSMDHLPSLPSTSLMGENTSTGSHHHQQHHSNNNKTSNIADHLEQLTGVSPPRLVKSEHGSPDSVPITALEDVTNPIPPLELSSFLDTFTPPPRPLALPLEQIVTSVPPMNISAFSFSTTTTTTTSPISCLAYQDPYNEQYFTSPDTDFALRSAAFSAPPVDWSSFPLYASDVPPTTSTQAPSYASMDCNYPTGLPAPSSSGDTSEVDEWGPFSGLGPTAANDLQDLHSVSEGSDVDHLRLSSASSFIGLPQAQLLSSTNLDSISIDDFLKSANESTAALEHQLQATMAMDVKSLPTPTAYVMSQTQSYEPISTPVASVPLTTATTSGTTTAAVEPVWPAALFDPLPTSAEEQFYRSSWV